MAGETLKTTAVCLAIHPWSRTSHVVAWLTPRGRVMTVVKGAVRPKSAFLGQYDLNYTCEIVYYARAKGELHALRECVPLDLREPLRGDYRALVLADYLRTLAGALAPAGPDGAAWFDLLDGALSELTGRATVARLLFYELRVLALLGLSPELEAEAGAFALRGERRIPISREVADCLRAPLDERNPQTVFDAARAIGVYYQLHVDCASDVRRTVVGMISKH